MYLKSVANAFFTPKMNSEASILKATDPKTAENAGNAAIAAAFLGKMYWRGEGFEVDEKQALDWFKKGSLLVRVKRLEKILFFIYTKQAIVGCSPLFGLKFVPSE